MRLTDDVDGGNLLKAIGISLTLSLPFWLFAIWLARTVARLME